MFLATRFQDVVQVITNPARISSRLFCWGAGYRQLWSLHWPAGICEIKPQRALLWVNPQVINGSFGFGKHYTDGEFPILADRKVHQRNQDVREYCKRESLIGKNISVHGLLAHPQKLFPCEFANNRPTHHVCALEILRATELRIESFPLLQIPVRWAQVRVASVGRGGQGADASVGMVESRLHFRGVDTIGFQPHFTGWTGGIIVPFPIVRTSHGHKRLWGHDLPAIYSVSGHGLPRAFAIPTRGMLAPETMQSRRSKSISRPTFHLTRLSAL